MRSLVLALFAALLAASPLAVADVKQVPASRAEIQLSFAPLVKATAPAVVNVYTKQIVRRRVASPLFDDPFFRRFYGVSPELSRKEERASLGSGVILRPDGLIVTNHHVIEGADEIVVALSDRRQFPATLVTSDARTDLALLRIDAGGESLPYLELRDSDELEVGDMALAIGNPFGVGQTVTSGIVSALARTNVGVSDLNSFIQTDAAINPGNSGGALVAMDGRLVGVNTAIFSRSGGSHGIGFAIPSEMVRTVVAAAEKGGPVLRPWIGAEGQSVTPDIAAALDLPRPVGALLAEVWDAGPAARAGLRRGDVVLSVDGHDVDGWSALRYRVATAAPGSKLKLRVWRGGQEREVLLDAETPPDTPARDPWRFGGRNALSGAEVANLSPAALEELALEGPPGGVVVVDVARGSPAARAGLRVGDRLTSLGGRELSDVRALRQALIRAGRGVVLTVERGGETLLLRLS